MYKKKIAIITVHGGLGSELSKTLNSIDQQVSSIDLNIVIANNIKNFNIIKYKKNYRNFIIGKDKSIWDAMNIGLKLTKKYFIFYLNSGDILYDYLSIYRLRKYILNSRNCYIFKTVLFYKNILFYPKIKYFMNDKYKPHPSFIRPPINKLYRNFFNEDNIINADGEWIKQEIHLSKIKKVDQFLSIHFLGGQSSSPNLNSVIYLFNYKFFDGIKELIKLILFKFFPRKYYYILIYSYKYFVKKKF